ncbi:MAG: methionyl-tRNA formyltransferase [Planctomycetaceae bacterium]|nr:methionyl-tRNA formyltransferase [Planctomycetaceae bacterium]
MGLRIVLMGTGEFALPPFSALLASSEHQVVGVYTQPERSGRGHHRHVNKVRVLAEEHGVPVYQPQKVNTQEVLEELAFLQADVFIVAAYGQILKPELLAIPRLGAFNLHGSLLPRHRGAAPVQYSIWKGDTLAGVTIFQIEPALDSGPMVGKVETEIGATETSGQLMLRLADLSVPLTLQTVDALEDGSAEFELQDVDQVTLAPKIKKEDGVIDWERSAAEIDCHVRAMQPWPKAVTWLHTEGRKPIRCILHAVRPLSESGPQAGVIRRVGSRLLVGCGSGSVEVAIVQPDGKKAMEAAGFVNGYGVGDGSRFGGRE